MNAYSDLDIISCRTECTHARPGVDPDPTPPAGPRPPTPDRRDSSDCGPGQTGARRCSSNRIRCARSLSCCSPSAASSPSDRRKSSSSLLSSADQFESPDGVTASGAGASPRRVGVDGADSGMHGYACWSSAYTSFSNSERRWITSARTTCTHFVCSRSLTHSHPHATTSLERFPLNGSASLNDSLTGRNEIFCLFFIIW